MFGMFVEEEEEEERTLFALLTDTKTICWKQASEQRLSLSITLLLVTHRSISGHIRWTHLIAYCKILPRNCPKRERDCLNFKVVWINLKYSANFELNLTCADGDDQSQPSTSATISQSPPSHTTFINYNNATFMTQHIHNRTLTGIQQAIHRQAIATNANRLTAMQSLGERFNEINPGWWMI